MSHLKIFGIRHHGAGSAKRLLQALENFQPDVVAVELPQESLQLIPLLDEKSIIPPFAFLFYNSQNPAQSIYLPLAVFSPEYQAILYSKKNKIPFVCLDLPAGISMVNSNFNNNTEDQLNSKQKQMIRDPIAFLAKKAGYQDSERWWEIHFEQWTDHEKLFDLVQKLMGELRLQSFGKDDEETLIREQYMRQQIRQLLLKSYQKIAIVCGAWHGPALTSDFLEKTSGECIKTLKSYETSTCLIPWTYKNMSLENGYSAGIQSPLWHESLFLNRHTACSQFLVKAVTNFRKTGKEWSPSSAIDAEILATNIALLRDIPVPGIEELIESAVCIFGSGNTETIEGLRDLLLCGEVTGQVSLGKQSLPFVVLFHEKLKKLRLNRFWKDGHSDTLSLDLRKDNQLKVSQFIHFTKLIELEWMHPSSSDVNALGTFHEYWQCHWHPELEIDLIQKGLYGNSLEEATSKYLDKKLNSKIEIYRIAQFFENALKSGFHNTLPLLSNKINQILLENTDIVQLSTLIRPLLSSIHYGALHQIDIQQIKNVFDILLPKLIIAFPEAIKFINDERSKQFLEVLLVIQLYFDKNEERDLLNLWKEQLLYLVNDDLAHPLIKGKTWNILLEQHWIELEKFIEAFQLQFSLRAEIPKAAAWIEGFLYNQTVFHLMHPNILLSLDQWIQSHEEAHFKEYLPLLRRVFDTITIGERQRIFNILLNEQNAIAKRPVPGKLLNADRIQNIDQLLTKLQMK